MLQNAKVTAFTVSELLRENQLEGEGGEECKITHPPTQIRVKLLYRLGIPLFSVLL